MKIYCLIDPRNDSVTYVGFTRLNLEERLKAHLADKGNTPKIDWLRKLKRVKLKPIIEQLEEVTEENWQDKEKFWIQYFKNEGFKLKNYTNGGECGPILKGQKQKVEHVKNAGTAKRKTTKEQDEEIRRQYLNKEKTIVGLASENNVSRHTIMRIVYGRVNHYEDKPDIRRVHPGIAKLTQEQADEIRSKYKKGKVSQKSLGLEYNLNVCTISEIITGKKYKSNQANKQKSA